eukprot:6939949-Prymnesium_polylepis.1
MPPPMACPPWPPASCGACPSVSLPPAEHGKAYGGGAEHAYVPQPVSPPPKCAPPYDEGGGGAESISPESLATSDEGAAHFAAGGGCGAERMGGAPPHGAGSPRSPDMGATAQFV